MLIRKVMHAVHVGTTATSVYFSKPERTQHPTQVVLFCFLRQEKSLIYILSLWYFLCLVGMRCDLKPFDMGYETKGLGSCLV